MTRPSQREPSTTLRNPMPDATDEGLKVLCALMERRNILLESQNVRLRACLELATGQAWDSENVADFSGDQLDKVVAQNMAHGLNISYLEAQKRVRLNKRLANPSQVESPDVEHAPDDVQPIAQPDTQ